MEFCSNYAHQSNHAATIDSEVLLRGIEQDDPDATDHLYAIIRRAMLGALRGHHLSHVEDLVQDAYLTVLHAVRQGHVRTPAAFVAYTIGVSRNVRAQFFSKNARMDMGDSEPLPHVPDNRKHFTAEFEQADTLEAIRATAACLSPHYRTIIEDFYFSAMTAEEVQARHALTETQFRLFKSRAIGKLRKRVRSYHPLGRLRSA
ncbi:MAG TPA: sigma-70 family RNA polymerase sigma factor [Bryobacteraceae bacterium]|nr:sigma-70 family RNA polymerase sigma factor [Bryobacteraceae bacterium]